MSRKPKREEHENHERWLVSYADFITLLFAFFVVMYSISSINEGKYRVLSSSLFTAFNETAKTVEPIQYGTPLKSPIIQHKSMVDDKNAVSRVGVDHQILPSPKELSEMQKMADEVEHNLKELIDKDLVKVNKTNLGIEIEIKSSILFASGSATLSRRSIPVLSKIANILNNTENKINVEGFTDNLPIKTLLFPSNWELSASRAASVVRLFTKSKISPERLKAIGYGEYKPIAPNNTAKGRNKNRRVAIIVLNKPETERKTLLDPKSKEHSKAVDKRPTKDALVLPSPRKNGSFEAVKSTKSAQKLKNISNPILLKRDNKKKPIQLPSPKPITIGNGVSQ